MTWGVCVCVYETTYTYILGEAVFNYDKFLWNLLERWKTYSGSLIQRILVHRHLALLFLGSKVAEHDGEKHRRRQ